MATVNALVLIGWMDRDDAVQYLREQCYFDPPLTEAEAEALWLPYRQRVEALPTRPIPAIPKNPVQPTDKGHIDKFKATFKGDPEIIDVINITVTDLLVYQWYVVTERSDEYAAQPGRWSRKTLVIDRPTAQIPIRIEDGIVKMNLPHAEHTLGMQQDGAFRIQQFAGFVSVVDIGGRLFLKAGYHRSFAFARSTMNAPDANDRLMLVALTRSLPPQLAPTTPNPGLRTTVLGDRPAFFGDFFDTALAMPVELRKRRWEAHFSIIAVDAP